MRWWLSLAVLGVGCGEEGSPADPCEQLTWETFGEGYLRSWCTGCHHSALTGEEREGAPAGMDFDDPDTVYAMQERILARATGEDPTMPPIGGSDAEERERFASWLRCGAP